MNEIYDSARVGAFEVRVRRDEWAGNPREDRETLATIWTACRDDMSPDPWQGPGMWDALAREFGVRPPPGRDRDGRFAQWDVLESDPARILAAMHRAAVVLPVWRLSHSGTVYRAAEGDPFGCPWDSGCVGFGWVTLDRVREEYGVQRVTAETRRAARDAIRADVDTWSAWAAGDVYQFEVVEAASGETVDSCGGYYGEPDYCLSEGIDSARWHDAQRLARRADRLKTLIRNRVPLNLRAPQLLAI